jgi:phosphatidylethanolamine/phosphatidyl-N-methylethanolamine N-methyltransferase
MTVAATKPGPLLFARKLWQHGTRVASFAPSSRFLARAMCRHIDPTTPQTVVELGAGTGAVTRVAAGRLHPDSRLIAVELDEDFAALCAAAVPRAEVRCQDVTALAELNLPAVDVVLSGLPTPSLPRAVNGAVFGWLEQMRPAMFSQLTVMPWVYRGLYRRLFEKVDFDLVPLNLPPGGVYHCRGLRNGWAKQLPKK